MSAGAPSASGSSRRLEIGANALTMLSVAPLIFARSIACRTASDAVSDPSVPTTIRVNMPPPSARSPYRADTSGGAGGDSGQGSRFGRFAAAEFVLVRFDVGGRQAAEAEADDFFRRRRDLHDRDHHRGREADDEDDQSYSPRVGHAGTPRAKPRPILADGVRAG